MKATEHSFLLCYCCCTRVFYRLSLKIEYLNVTIQMKAIEQFRVLLLITLYKVPEVLLLNNIFLEFCFLIC